MSFHPTVTDQNMPWARKKHKKIYKPMYNNKRKQSNEKPSFPVEEGEVETYSETSSSISVLVIYVSLGLGWLLFHSLNPFMRQERAITGKHHSPFPSLNYSNQNKFPFKMHLLNFSLLNLKQRKFSLIFQPNFLKYIV